MSTPIGHVKKPSRNRIRQRTKELRRAISAMDFVASGTLHTRTKVCGRKNCRCAVDPDARHGPYYEWSRRQEGRLVHSVVTAEQAQLCSLARSAATVRFRGYWRVGSTKRLKRSSTQTTNRTIKCRKTQDNNSRDIGGEKCGM
jgi:hypothetical protein